MFRLVDYEVLQTTQTLPKHLIEKSKTVLRDMDIYEQWQRTKGKGAKIAIIDTGVDVDHPDLKHAIKKKFNAFDCSEDVEDKQGHGCIAPTDKIYTSEFGLQTIEDFYNSVSGKAIIDKESTIKDISRHNITTFAVNKQGYIEKDVIQAVHKLRYKGKVYKIKTKEGQLTLTPWHPVYVVTSLHTEQKKDITFIKKRADELRKGDRILLPRNTVKLNNTLTVNGFELDEKLAYYCGLIASNGHLIMNQPLIEFFGTDKALLDEFVKLSMLLFGKEPNIYKDKRSSNPNYFKARLYSHDAYNTLSLIGIPIGEKSKTFTIPKMICKSPQNIVAAFIAGMLDGDGCIYDGKIRLITGSVKFAEDLVYLLRTFGIRSSYQVYKASKTDSKNEGDSYQIRIPNWIEVTSNLKASRFRNEIKKLPSMQSRKTVSILKISVEEYDGFLYDLTVANNHNYIANGMIVSNTHVAGIIAANGIITGVAPEADLYIVKALGNDGKGTLESLIKGIEWCISQDVDVISMSLGSQQDSRFLKTVLKKAVKRNIIPVCAAGNDAHGNHEAITIDYPARYDFTIAVGAIDLNNKIANFSSAGNVDVVAFGVQVLSTYKNGSYALLSGTSMATPYISGSIGLLQALAKKRLGRKLTVDEIKLVLSLNARDLGKEGKDIIYGYGEFAF